MSIGACQLTRMKFEFVSFSVLQHPNSKYIILVFLGREWDGKIAIESRGKAEVSTSTLDNPLHRFTHPGWFRGVTTSGNLPLKCYQWNQPGVYYFHPVFICILGIELCSTWHDFHYANMLVEPAWLTALSQVGRLGQRRSIFHGVWIDPTGVRMQTTWARAKP